MELNFFVNWKMIFNMCLYSYRIPENYLARIIGVSRSSINNWKSGGEPCSYNKIELLFIIWILHFEKHIEKLDKMNVIRLGDNELTLINCSEILRRAVKLNNSNLILSETIHTIYLKSLERLFDKILEGTFIQIHKKNLKRGRIGRYLLSESDIHETFLNIYYSLNDTRRQSFLQ